MDNSSHHYRDERWRLASIIEGARIGTWEWNVQTGETVFNDTWSAIIGYSLDELAPVSIKTWESLTHPDDLEKSNQLLERHFKGELPWYDCECRMRHKQGHWVWIHDRGKVITRTPDGAPLMMFGTHIDITKSKRAEESLRANEHKYRAMFDQSLLGIYLHDLEGRIIDVNEMACAQSGYSKEELLRRTVFDNHPKVTTNQPKKEIIAQWKSWQPGQRVIVEAEHQREDGTVYPVEISTGRIRFNDTDSMLAIVQDITERKRAEESLLTIQRLESLGVLAGGIAHDFNNLLSGIFGFIDLALHATDDSRVSEYLNETMKSLKRATWLTQQLLTFSRGGEPVRATVNLFPFLEETALFALSGSNVSCQVDAPQDLWKCNIDRNQVAQVIDNVVINAREAMPNGGVIRIFAKNLEVETTGNVVLKPGRYVEVSVADQGIGIAKEIINRIFEPFYTTKTKGHGLGLATCYSIMKRHGGYIDVMSEQGKGTTFQFYLPAALETSVSDDTEADVAVHVGDGMVLVMDDDEALLKTTEEMLKSFGYKVVCVTNGESAIDFFSKHRDAGGNLTAMIFDLTISKGMGGKQAVQEIRQICSDIPIFVCSGYADDPIMAHPKDYGFTASLAKPFRMAALAQVLNEHLTAKR